MPDQHSDKAPVTFRDVAACFSEEEWKLLHEWQKELYKNVMKEIQQALLSLGPLIATSVFSVRAKENEDLCCMDHQDSKRRNGMTPPPSDTVVNCDVLFTINREESQYLIEPPDGDGRESNDGLSTGFPSFNSANTLRMEQDLNAGVTDNPDAKGGESSTGTRTGDAAATEIVVFSIKEEGDTYSIDHQGFEKRESISAPTGFPPFSTESEASVMNPINAGDKECCPVLNSEFQLFNPDKSAEGGESNPHLNLTGDVGISPFASFNIKEEEGGSSSMDHQDSKRNESVGNPKGDPVVISVLPQHIINKEETHFHEDQGADRKQTGVPLAMSILSQPGAHEEETHSREEQEVVGINKGCQPHTGTMKEKDTDPATSCAKSFTRKGNRLLHQKIYTSERSFSCPQCMKRFTQKAQLLNHQRIHKGDRPFSYTECGKSFHQKKDIVKHQRIHTGEKPFYCTECGKRFNSKPHLKRHQVIHSRQKSFHCTKCEKGFNRKENLQRHEKLHTQRSFCCTQCPLSFHLKGRLLRHQIIHTKVIGYSCSECKKSFTRKGNLVLHQKIHTKDAPFFCSECKKSFTRKGNLVVHQRIHTKDAPFSCSECKKSFARKGYLVLHQRTHTKERSLFPHSVKTALV